MPEFHCLSHSPALSWSFITGRPQEPGNMLKSSTRSRLTSATKSCLIPSSCVPRNPGYLAKLVQYRQNSSSSSSGSGNSSSDNANLSKSQGFAYGLLASVAVFSSILGYSVSEWSHKDSKAAIKKLTTWKDVKYGSHADVEAAIAELKAALPAPRAVTTDPPVLRSYGYSENSYHPSAPHAVVARAKSTEDVSTIVKIANKYRIPVTAYGGGTSLEGHFSGVSSSFFVPDRSILKLMCIFYI